MFRGVSCEPHGRVKTFLRSPDLGVQKRNKIDVMGKVVTTFVNPTFDIEEATLVLFNGDSMQDLTISTFPVRSNVA